MKRNIFKCSDMGIDKLVKNHYYGLSLEEVNQIIKRYTKEAEESTQKNSLLDLITLVYAAGFENGTRYSRNIAKH